MTDVNHDILKALRNGTTPQVGVSKIAVGLEPVRNQINKELEYVATGKTDGKFIAGNYGSGKTFLSKVIFEDALNQNFAASEVIISPDIRLDNFSELYSAILSGLRIQSKRNTCALSDILEKWLFDLQKKVRDLQGNSGRKVDRKQIAGKLQDSLEEELGKIKDFNISISNALRAYMKGCTNQNREVTNDAIGWLRGDQNLPYKKKARLGVKGDIEDDDVMNALASMLFLIKEAGYKGLVIILDEVETVQRLHTRNQRNNAYENLRKIVDAFGSEKLPGAYFFITGTDSLFNDHRVGIPSYEALEQRIQIPDTDQATVQNYRQLIIPIKGQSKKNLAKIAMKVRDIHGELYHWNPQKQVRDSFITQYATDFVTAFDREFDKPPREFLRIFVDLLDKIEQHGGAPSEYIKEY